MAAYSIPQSVEIIKELRFTTSRSSGPGGQNVNKVNSKVALKWDIINSQILNNEQRALLLKKLHTQISNEGILMLTSQENRSQLQNKEAVLSKLDKILTKILTRKKKRKPTRPSKAATRKRIDEKKHRAKKKQWRQKPL